MRATAITIAATVLLAATGGCENTNERAAAKAGPPAQRAVTAAPAPPDGISLCDVRVLEFPRHRLVTPRWSPRGDRLLVSGWGGVGLYLVESLGAAPAGAGRGGASTASLREIDPGVGGGAAWAPGGDAVSWPAAGGGFVEHDLRTSRARAVDRPPHAARAVDLPESGLAAAVVAEADGRTVLFEEYRGRILVVAGGIETVAVGGDAWGVTPSPDGRRIAYCTGTLLEPELRVLVPGGEDRIVGRGAQPSWFPDSARLAYSVPVAGVGEDGFAIVDGAEIWSIDLGAGAPAALTRTPDVVEMEPAVSPDGARTAFADWRSGGIWVARVAPAGASCGGAP